jgi:hypothetical protein
MADIGQIRASIDRRLTDLAQEVASLTAARAALIEQAAAAANGAAPAPASASKRRAGARSSTRTRKPVEPLARQTAQALLEETGGLSTAALARRAGTTQASAKEALDGLAASGLARSWGSGRAGVWRLLTDEERIAARAAELEAQLAAVAAARAGRARS